MKLDYDLSEIETSQADCGFPSKWRAFVHSFLRSKPSPPAFTCNTTKEPTQAAYICGHTVWAGRIDGGAFDGLLQD
jgi:hypothetical protein